MPVFQLACKSHGVRVSLVTGTTSLEMRYILMKLRAPQQGIVLLLSVLFLAVGSPGGAQADLSPVKRDFRNLCQSLKMKCARSAPAKKTRKATAPRQNKKAKAANTAAIKPKPEAAPPVPRVKPVRITAPIKTDSSAVKASTPIVKFNNTPIVKSNSAPIVKSNNTSIVKSNQENAPAVKSTVATVKNPPIPRPKPEPDKKIASIARPQKDLSTTVTPEVRPTVPDNGCLATLRNSGVQFDAVATPVGNGRCQVDVPVRLHAVQTTAGKIALPDSPVLSCRFARQFVLWLSDTGAALVSTHLDIKLAKVSTGPGYECRGRNGDASAKLSEHASGNAVDITTITTEDGRNIQVSDAGNPASASFKVLRGLRTTACGYFSTVLGPGSNEAHASHFHFDMGMHGKSQNYRICE